MIETVNVKHMDHAEIQTKGELDNYSICKESRKTLEKHKFSYLFPIQSYTFDHIFKGDNVLARDHTGSGKTLAFTLPLLERLRQSQDWKSNKTPGPRVLIIAPTRELAIQSKGVLEMLQNDKDEFRLACLYGGKNMFEQKRQLSMNPRVVIGTPG